MQPLEIAIYYVSLGAEPSQVSLLTVLATAKPQLVYSPHQSSVTVGTTHFPAVVHHLAAHFFKIFFKNYVYEPACMSVHSVHRGQRVSDPLELQFWVLMGWHMGLGK